MEFGTEFWSAIAGAVVGGLISFGVQIIALQAAKKQRDEDHKRVQQALGSSLLFKMLRIHTNVHQIHAHIEGCFAEAEKLGVKAEPWQFVLPLANPPPPVEFSADEMGMLLAQNDNAVFNTVHSMDQIHNGLIDLMMLISTRRQALLERLPTKWEVGPLFGSVVDKEEVPALRPAMFEINDLINQTRARAKWDADEAERALNGLGKILHEKLKLPYKLAAKSEIEKISGT